MFMVGWRLGCFRLTKQVTANAVIFFYYVPVPMHWRSIIFLWQIIVNDGWRRGVFGLKSG